MPSPTVTVLINNRDHAGYLRSCIDSVLTQTRPADEIIVYDDGSVDRSREILGEYGSRIQLISGARSTGTAMQNQAEAIERAFAHSTGELVFLLDADDLYAPNHIEAYVAAFVAQPKAIMVQAPLWKIDADGLIVGLEYDARRHTDDYLRHIYTTHEVNIYYPTSALAFRRWYLEERLPLRSDDLRWLWPDAQLALVAPHFGGVVTLPEPQTYWRRHPRSHTVMKKTSVYEQVRLNRIFYNRFCRERGLRPIRAWRSAQHIKRWLRHNTPGPLLRVYQRFFPPQLPGGTFPTKQPFSAETKS